MSKFKLGPVQEQWLKNLEAYPERQCTDRLGDKNADGTYSACCLGELLLTYKRIRKKKLPFNDEGLIFDYNPVECYAETSNLEYSYKKLGLHNADGGLFDPVTGKLYVVPDHKPISNLAMMNDNGWTWPAIAAFIRKHPEFVFTKSV